MMYDSNEVKACCCSAETETPMEKQCPTPPIPEFTMRTHDTLCKMYALLEAIDRAVSGVRAGGGGSDFKTPENLLENAIANSELAAINMMRICSIAKVLGVNE